MQRPLEYGNEQARILFLQLQGHKTSICRTPSLSGLTKLTHLGVPSAEVALVVDSVDALPNLRRIDFALLDDCPGHEPDDIPAAALAAFGMQTHLVQLHLRAASCLSLAALQLPPSLTVRTQQLGLPPRKSRY